MIIVIIIIIIAVIVIIMTMVMITLKGANLDIYYFLLMALSTVLYARVYVAPAPWCACHVQHVTPWQGGERLRDTAKKRG